MSSDPCGCDGEHVCAEHRIERLIAERDYWKRQAAELYKALKQKETEG